MPQLNGAVADFRATGRTIAFLSPAALLVIISLLKRGFVNGPQVQAMLIGPRPEAAADYLTTSDVLRMAKNGLASVPSLRDVLLNYFEVSYAVPPLRSR